MLVVRFQGYVPGARRMKSRGFVEDEGLAKTLIVAELGWRALGQGVRRKGSRFRHEKGSM